MCDSKTSSSDTASKSSESLSSFRAPKVSHCSYAEASSQQCPLYSAVLQYGDLERLKINGEGEPTWLHNNDPILLHSAVQDNNLDAVCAMLYYGVNIGDPSVLAFEPLQSGFCNESIEIAKVLINFYDNEYLRQKIPFSYNRLVHLLSLYVQHDVTLFKLLFRRIDLNDVDQLNYLFTSLMEVACDKLSTEDWLECVYLILKNIKKPSPHLHYQSNLNAFSYFYERLFNRFFDKKVQREDRLRIIYICLSFGIAANVRECEICYELYGFGDELEGLIYGMNCKNYETISNQIVLLILPAVANLNDTLFTNVTRNKLFYFEQRRWTHFLDFLGFYSLSLQQKEVVKRHSSLKEKSYNPRIFEVLQKVNRIPVFPTLFELSRNQIRIVIHKEVKCPYRFHDSIKQLDLPGCIKDKIRLKTPIY